MNDYFGNLFKYEYDYFAFWANILEYKYDYSESTIITSMEYDYSISTWLTFL